MWALSYLTPTIAIYLGKERWNLYGCLNFRSSYYICNWCWISIVALKVESDLIIDLATLGLQGCGPRGSPRVTSHTTRNERKCEGVWGSERSHSQGNSHFGKWNFGGLPKFQKMISGAKTQWLMAFFHIIGKLFERRCLKWAHIAHSDIWNTSYGQKKGLESNCQFDSRPEKVRNRPDLLGCKQRFTYHWKALDESYNFTLDRTSIRDLITKLWGSKVARVLAGAISGLPEREKPFGCRLYGQPHSIL